MSGFFLPGLPFSLTVSCRDNAGPCAPSDAVPLSQFPACRLACGAWGEASSGTVFQLTSQRMEASLRAQEAPKIEAPQGHRAQLMTTIFMQSHEMEKNRGNGTEKRAYAEHNEAFLCGREGQDWQVRQSRAIVLWEHERAPVAGAQGCRCAGQQVCRAASVQGSRHRGWQAHGVAGTEGDRCRRQQVQGGRCAGGRCKGHPQVLTTGVLPPYFLDQLECDPSCIHHKQPSKTRTLRRAINFHLLVPRVPHQGLLTNGQMLR